jgi:hypothetical protein
MYEKKEKKEKKEKTDGIYLNKKTSLMDFLLLTWLIV